MSHRLTVEESALQIFNEGFVNETKLLKEDILNLFEQYGTNTFTVQETIKNIKRTRHGIKENKILRVIQDMINEQTLKHDNKTKRLFIMNEEDSLDDDTEITDEDQVLEYFNSSVSGSITGIDFTEAVKAIKEQYGISKPNIIKAISKLIKEGKLQKGPKENTIVVISSDNEDEDEDEESSIMPSLNIGLNDNQRAEHQPLTNQETPETLKAKGWTEVSPGIYESPDKKSQFILTPESTNNNFLLNKNMNFKNSYDYERLCEEFEEEIDSIESFDTNEDNTDGLDEFTNTEDETTDTEMTDEDEYTVTLSKSEVDVLKKILGQLDVDVEAETEDEDIDLDDEDDDFIDDEATDEEATDDLVDGEDDFTDEEDEEEDVDIDIEEDAEELADAATAVHDGSFSNGAPTFRKGGNTYGDKRRKPISSKPYTPATGSVYDGSGRNGAPSLTKHNATLDRGGKPVKSKQTSGTGKSLFDL